MFRVQVLGFRFCGLPIFIMLRITIILGFVNWGQLSFEILKWGVGIGV